ncbi:MULTISPECIES: SRPBCC family protein [unclassified Streptomyces]|uniref:SRPBCC family protein n=1 Tax=unclassified Streptomyces TaxID=2593676 RepID=UPI002E3382CB|nr:MULTISPECIES: SRPBCC domain-containing protein [unclassified Streptomyces]WUC65755.1 SRPBCC domain-containing protein [Streptomyces sp. NBC_00539]
MEHQLFVPVPADDLRAVLRDPARVARCVPGLQQDADTASGPLAGRLKVRVGGHTVTYRGALAVTERDPDHFAVEGEGVEVRGSGTVKLALTLRLTAEGNGTRLELSGGGAADGRAAGFPPEATAAAVQRLLDRTADNLAAAVAAEPEPAAEPAGAAEPVAEPVADPVADAEDAEDADPGFDDVEDGITEITESVFDAEVPPPSLDPLAGGGFEDRGEPGALDGPALPPAEAAHARRTMIGRSAEEVDHAPPRGRYAPVPAPSSVTAGAGLRWIAPAAAVAVASAVVLGRVLRRRR